MYLLTPGPNEWLNVPRCNKYYSLYVSIVNTTDLRILYKTVKLITCAAMVDISPRTYYFLFERDGVKRKSAETTLFR